MMLVGIFWAALAPLSLVLAIGVLRWQLRGRQSQHAWTVAASIVVLPVAVVYGLDRNEFRRVCDEEGMAVVTRQVAREGIFLDSPTANSFGTRYVESEGFKWVEMRDIYRRSAYVRMEREKDGKISTTQISESRAKAVVEERHESRGKGISVNTTRVIDRETGEVLSRASLVHFDGGRLFAVLGAWGTSQCPHPGKSDGEWNRYYHLAKVTLQPGRSP